MRDPLRFEDQSLVSTGDQSYGQHHRSCTLLPTLVVLLDHSRGVRLDVGCFVDLANLPTSACPSNSTGILSVAHFFAGRRTKADRVGSARQHRAKTGRNPKPRTIFLDEEDKKDTQAISDIASEAVSAIEEAREISYNLRPIQLDCLGLTRTIQTIMKRRRTPKEIFLTSYTRRTQPPKLIALGNTSGDIGRKLSLSYLTIENHRTNICRELDIKGPNALLRFAVQHKVDL
jgi:hypothetical protein